MQSNRTAYPLALIYLDYWGPLQLSAEGFKYVLTMKDNFTGYIWLEATKEQDTDAVARALEKNIFAHHGFPDMITTDNASVFNSKKMEELCKKLNITKRNIVPSNPQSNSAERAHKTMGQIFRTLAQGHEQQWDKFIPSIVLALNSAVHRTTGFSPINAWSSTEVGKDTHFRKTQRWSKR